MSDHDKTLAERDRNDRTHAGTDTHDGHVAGPGHDDHGDHGHHGVGAHEVDKMPSGRLFNLLFGLSGLTLVACIGVVQLFYRQVDTIRDTRDTKVSFQLAEYRAEMDALKTGAVVEMSDDDGVPGAEGGKGVHDVRRFQMPLAEARKRVLEQPQLLKAGRPYRGWRNPDPNAPKVVAPTRPQPRNPGQRMPMQPGADGRPQGILPPAGAVPPAGVVPPAGAVPPAGVVPVQPGRPPVEGKAPAEAPAPAEGKAPKGDGKAEGKANE